MNFAGWQCQIASDRLAIIGLDDGFAAGSVSGSISTDYARICIGVHSGTRSTKWRCCMLSMTTLARCPLAYRLEGILLGIMGHDSTGWDIPAPVHAVAPLHPRIPAPELLA
ncbi:uncharacterized protein N7503_006819 [Penicillium pulvis]|uniref:uncharacterized protein n=1 Tax=Penicillium pulvis TaxID=1562058 RepID=UPI002547F2EC|nr:uncharacterized protein N7503_006819 [Penicillium pulvis]KAJ5797523.1 hypothetical protein N7503_006819 [Penicillium pulvis]